MEVQMITSSTYPALRRLCMEAVLSLDSLVCFCNTKISEFFDMAKSWAARLVQELFVAQVFKKFNL